MHINRLSVSSSTLTVMLKAALMASKGLKRDFGELENLQVSWKSTGGFVTKSDKQSEKIIYEILNQARPNFGFVMEESGEISGTDPRARWIVDPLDGTTNFMHGYPHFAISIALEYDNEIVAGLTYDPIKDEIFYAEKGRGSFMNDRRIRISGRQESKQAMIGIGFPHRPTPTTTTFYQDFFKVNAQVAAVRKTGSTALDLAYVAAGRLDTYIGFDTKVWDSAAGILLVKEAGGIIYNFDAQASNHYDETIIAGNEKMVHLCLNHLNSAH